MDGILRVKMFGRFSLDWNEKHIDDNDNRARMSWLLLAYLICHRDRRITQDELLRVLWENNDEYANPQSALKTLLHRTRTMLNALGDNAGHRLIVWTDGHYEWNNTVPLVFDVDDFNAAVQAGQSAETDEERLKHYRKAMELYTGDFLPKLSMEKWTVPVETYYHELYVKTATDTVRLLEESGQKEEAVRVCQKALEWEPYSEPLFLRYLRNLLDIGDRDSVIRAYEKFSTQLFSTFGVQPPAGATAIYREAATPLKGSALPIGTLQDQLEEDSTPKGAVLCDFDMFRMFYRTQSRLLFRSGDSYHVALFTLTGKNGQEISRRSLDTAMKNFQDHLQSRLRASDTFSRCSVCQFVLILPQANYENSGVVCERAVRSYFQRYPRSPVDVDFSVLPMEPSMPFKDL